jgi:hypothetical protein
LRGVMDTRGMDTKDPERDEQAVEELHATPTKVSVRFKSK